MRNKSEDVKEPVEDKKLEEVLKERDIHDLCNELEEHFHALRAFGVLLKGADLCEFADIAFHTLSPGDQLDGDALELRWGLSQIIDMYLEKQKRILSKACGFQNDDLDVINRAEHAINLVGQSYDGTKTDGLYKRLEKAVKDLDNVINEEGDFAEKARKLKKNADGYIKMENERKLRSLQES